MFKWKDFFSWAAQKSNNLEISIILQFSDRYVQFISRRKSLKIVGSEFIFELLIES